MEVQCYRLPSAWYFCLSPPRCAWPAATDQRRRCRACWCSRARIRSRPGFSKSCLCDLFCHLDHEGEIMDELMNACMPWSPSLARAHQHHLISLALTVWPLVDDVVVMSYVHHANRDRGVPFHVTPSLSPFSRALVLTGSRSAFEPCTVSMTGHGGCSRCVLCLPRVAPACARLCPLAAQLQQLPLGVNGGMTPRR